MSHGRASLWPQYPHAPLGCALLAAGLRCAVRLQVFDVYSTLQSAVYAALDARAVEATCGQAVPVMEQHWGEGPSMCAHAWRGMRGSSSLPLLLSAVWRLAADHAKLHAWTPHVALTVCCALLAHAAVRCGRRRDVQGVRLTCAHAACCTQREAGEWHCSACKYGGTWQRVHTRAQGGRPIMSTPQVDRIYCCSAVALPLKESMCVCD